MPFKERVTRSMHTNTHYLGRGFVFVRQNSSPVPKPTDALFSSSITRCRWSLAWIYWLLASLISRSPFKRSKIKIYWWSLFRSGFSWRKVWDRKPYVSAPVAVVAKLLIVGRHLDVPGTDVVWRVHFLCLIPEICIAGTQGADTLFM